MGSTEPPAPARTQHFRHFWVTHDRPNLIAEKVRRSVVGPFVDQKVVEGETEAEAAAHPARLVFAVALFLWQ
jgi:hypothetical protein